MKKIFTQLVLTCCLLAVSSTLFANFIIVKGFVKYNNGSPFANHLVKVSVDSTTNPTCYHIASKITDITGYYIDTLTCNADIKKVIVTTEDCNGSQITNTPAIILTNTPTIVPGVIVVESNFTTSCPPPNTLPPLSCSDSIFYSVQPSSTSLISYIKFYSKAIVPAGDSVISHVWSFGDSTYLTGGNSIDPSHQYSHPGIYNACVTITTARGCQSRACTTVTIPNNSIGDFIIVKGYVKYSNGSPVPKHLVKVSVDSTTNPTCYYINSKSTDSTGFYIDTLTCKTPIKNVIVTTEDCNGNKLTNSPAITPGATYVISNFTLSCTAPVPAPVTCSDSIFYSIQPVTPNLYTYVKFNSKYIITSGDSVISHIWNFGDSTTLLTSNLIDPTHVYSRPGIFNACVTIVTKKGCESKACTSITIPNNSIGDFIIVKGTVKYADGKPFPKHLVKVSVDSTTNPNCYYINSRITDSTGFYIDTLTCKTPIRKIMVTTEDCNGNMIINSPVIIAGATIVQSDFTLSCKSPVPPPVTCSDSIFYAIQPANTNLYSYIKFNSKAFIISGDSVTNHIWSFGDGTYITGGNIKDPSHQYTAPGIYNACVTIVTKKGCESKACTNVTIPNSTAGDFLIVKGYVKYNNGSPFPKHLVKISVDSTTNPTCYSVNTRITDSTGFYIDTLTCSTPIKKVLVTTEDCNGNKLTNSPAITAGTNYVISNFTVSCAPPPVTPVIPIKCAETVSYTILAGNEIKFNSKTSTIAGDSVISHLWSFGDSTYLSGNIVDPTHKYPHPGIYYACLTIKTAKGCESRTCVYVVVLPNNIVCKATFDYQRVLYKKAAFNSSMSEALPGDSIIQRNWTFGDGTTLGGNIVSPVKEYPSQGDYTVCLRIKTAKGCESESCIKISIQDSTATNPGSTEPIIRIISLNPNPVITQFAATIWSKLNNVNTDISIYDIYGIKKWSTQKVLQQGNNVIGIYTGFLTNGPYFLRITTAYGTESRAFYKL